MTRASIQLVAATAVTLAASVCFWPESASQAKDQEKPAPPKMDPALAGSTIAALLEANDGKPPATGKELWQALSKLGKFAQLPVVFSAVRLDSGIGNPRVVITPVVSGLGESGPAEPSLNGRLYLAANMEKDPKGGDPRVTSVEFISWNTLRRKFDFGVIENMGGDEPPELRVVDGGRCFACHKNRGPILGAVPWLNTTDLVLLRDLVAQKLNLVNVIPPGGAGGKRDRIDGMALVSPAAPMVDAVVRVGALLPFNRDTFRLMNKSEGGRKAFVAMLLAIAEPRELVPYDRTAKTAVDLWGNEQSYLHFTKEWVDLAKATNTGVLLDFAPFSKAQAKTYYPATLKPLPTPPPGGFRSASEAKMFETRLSLVKFNNDAILKAMAEQTELIARYDEARAKGKHGMVSAAQPSNPKAFVPPAIKAKQKASDMVNPLMLANTIGLTEGDRKFMADALTDAAKHLAKQRVTTATLAKEVFVGPEFADVLAGGPLPDRDDFKDRFVAGLNALLTSKYKLTSGFTPERSTYATAPRRDPKTIEEVEAAIVPTTACLRCHDVRAGAKGRLFEPIPALVFDPLDKQAREQWAKTTDPKRKQEVLSRLLERVSTDADMPPQDSPEHDLFKVKQAAAFDDLKRYLEAEVEKSEKPKKP